MPARRIDAPETALIVDEQLTETEARVLARDVARVARAYGIATAHVRKCKRALRVAQEDVRALRRQMRLLISARRR